MTRRSFFCVAMAAAVAVSAGTMLGRGSEAMTIDLANMIPSLESEFSLWRTGKGNPGEWKIIGDPTAAGGLAIAQISKDKTDYRFPLAIYKPFSGKDVDVSVRFKAVGGTIDQAGGIVVRLLTPNDYYVLRANALEDNVRFYRVVKGKREQLAGADTKVSGNTWHTLALRAEGERFSISFDGKALFEARDATFADAGKVGLWTKADSVTYFDDLRIQTS
jgi:hypothetical protein